MATDEEAGLNEASGQSTSGASGRSQGLLGSVRSSFHDVLVEPILSRFDVPHKAAPEEALAKWRKASLVLNAARRFRYTADLQKRPKLGAKQKFRVGSLAIKALGRFKSKGHHDDPTLKLAKEHGFETSSRALCHLVANGQTKILGLNGGVKGIAAALKTDVATGIDGSPEDVEKRQKVFGTNTYPEKPMKTFLGFVWDACQDVTLMILAVCAVLSLAIGLPTEGLAEGWYDGAGILFSIAIVVLVTATSDYRQSIQFKELEDEKKKVNVEVMRHKRRQKISIFDLVVGDIIYLSIGDIIPADGLYISGHSLVIDESSMTGESDPLQKNDEHPFLLSGTKVQDGSAIMIATGVGMNTEWGHLMATLSESGDDETPLQVRLSGVATLIGRLGLGVAVLVFIVLMVRFLFTVNFSAWSSKETVQIVNFFAIAVTIIVVAVPEGLPLAVTLTLAYAMKRMMKDKALVRKLAACETMGSATTICSDKTGTLTTNKMAVVKAWLGGSIRTPENARNALSEESKNVLLEGIFNNTSGDVDEKEGAGGAVEVSVLGSPTETAILNLALGFGGKFNAVRGETECVQIDPFNSKRKRMGCVVKLRNGMYRAHWKGAAEIILAMCDRAVDAQGQAIPLKKSELEQVITGFADQALRTLSLAYKDIPSSEAPGGDTWPENEPIPDSGFTLQAVVGIKDPLRQGVDHCVALCQSAGIKVRMVTGDNVNTAKAIARECGILTEGGEAIEGPVFRDLPPDEMRRLIPKLQVMARSSPTDKHTLVRELRAMGEVVAVTGDGTNDAPALHEADIGLAMGIAGTEVAKESADIIILDDNFATIVTVAKWGRSVYNNIQKFVQFQLTVNIVALITNFVSACVSGSAPLTAVQLLWVNLIMDTLGALALATEPPDDSLMTRPPIGRKGKLVTGVMWRNIAIMAAYQLAVLFALQFAGRQILGYHGADAEQRVLTIIFNSFVLCQVFNEFNSRDMERLNILRGVFTNIVFLAVIAVTVVFQVILVQFLGKFASTVPLNMSEWLLCIGIGFVGVPLALVGKLLPVSDDGRALKPHARQTAQQNGYVPVPGDASDHN